MAHSHYLTHSRTLAYTHPHASPPPPPPLPPQPSIHTPKLKSKLKRSAIFAPATQRVIMAGRSFKPASYLASAQSPKLKPARPPFARTASNSSAQSTQSTKSTQSDDSFILSLKALHTSNLTDDHGEFLSDGGGPRFHTAGRFCCTTGMASYPAIPWNSFCSMGF